MLRKIKLSERKIIKPVLKGRRLVYNASAQAWYVRKLKALNARLTEKVMREVLKLIRSPLGKSYFAMDESLASQMEILLSKLTLQFSQLFNDEGWDLARQMVEQQDKLSAITLHTSLEILTGMKIKTNFMTAKLNDVYKASVSQNVDLIKSIPSEYLNRVKGAVMRSITTGTGIGQLEDEMQKYTDINERRVRNMALDQTRKAYNTINAERMKKVDVQKFEWLHSGGSLHPREDHVEMDGEIYSFDDLPVINKATGEKGIPGQAPNCRCTMRPVIEFDNENEEGQKDAA